MAEEKTPDPPGGRPEGEPDGRPEGEPPKGGAKDPFVIRMASFEGGYPFETRQGAFHSYTYIPFLGWLDPIHLNLIIFVVVIALAIGCPTAVNRARRSRGLKETPAKLASMRRAVAAFKKDTAWTVPNLDALVRTGRLQHIPAVDLYPSHNPSSAVMEGSKPDDSGGWGFDPAQADPERAVFVNCTHTDRNGKAWSSY